LAHLAAEMGARYRGVVMVRVTVLVMVLTAGCGRVAFEPMESENCQLAFAATSPRVNFHSKRTLEATMGLPPYRFAVVAGDAASIDAETGELVSGGQPGVVQIAVSDAEQCEANVEVTVGGDRLWYVGGSSNAVPQRDVWSSTDGVTWAHVGMLPGPRQYGGLLVYRDRLWYLSGSATGSNFNSEVFSSTDGVTWTMVGLVPVGATSFGHAVFAGRMWMVGGNNNAAKIVSSDDGVSWRSEGSLPMDNHGGSLGVLGDKLVYAGGHNGALFNWVLASADGAAWTQIGTLAQAREYHSTITIGDTMWIVGGQDTTPTALASVVATTTGAAFAPMTALPAERAFGALARLGERLWSVGGTNGAGVWSAALDGTWRVEETNFPLPRQGGGIAVFTPPN
jgi:hypothetical protein